MGSSGSYLPLAPWLSGSYHPRSGDGLQVDSCYHRSLGWLGSTAARPNTTLLMPADPGGWGCWAAGCPPQVGGILSGEPRLNPLMAGWNKVDSRAPLGH